MRPRSGGGPSFKRGLGGGTRPIMGRWRDRALRGSKVAPPLRSKRAPQARFRKGKGERMSPSTARVLAAEGALRRKAEPFKLCDFSARPRRPLVERPLGAHTRHRRPEGKKAASKFVAPSKAWGPQKRNIEQALRHLRPGNMSLRDASQARKLFRRRDNELSDSLEAGCAEGRYSWAPRSQV